MTDYQVTIRLTSDDLSAIRELRAAVAALDSDVSFSAVAIERLTFKDGTVAVHRGESLDG